VLRRVAKGERVNEVDWDHVIDEIEDVGLSELHAVESSCDCGVAVAQVLATSSGRWRAT
jgi:hypothetical protein